MEPKDIPALVSSQVIAWQREHHTILIQAYPPDWTHGILYSEWQTIDPSHEHHGKKKTKTTTANGFSDNHPVLEDLHQRLLNIEMLLGITIDHVYFSKKHRTLTTLWHLPTGPRVRKFGSAPLPEPTTEKSV